MKLSVLITFLVLSLSSAFGFADTPQKNEDGVTEIYLDQFGGYFAARDTFAGLKKGKYQFIVTNKTHKLVGFQLQNFKSHAPLDMFPLEPGETKRSDVIDITEDGFRFRCPLNPTPWYDADNIK